MGTTSRTPKVLDYSQCPVPSHPVHPIRSPCTVRHDSRKGRVMFARWSYMADDYSMIQRKLQLDIVQSSAGATAKAAHASMAVLQLCSFGTSPETCISSRTSTASSQRPALQFKQYTDNKVPYRVTMQCCRQGREKCSANTERASPLKRGAGAVYQAMIMNLSLCGITATVYEANITQEHTYSNPVKK